jgi:hypothetical protein
MAASLYEVSSAESHRWRHGHERAGVTASEDCSTLATTRGQGSPACMPGDLSGGLSGRVENGRTTCMLQRAGLKRR